MKRAMNKKNNFDIIFNKIHLFSWLSFALLELRKDRQTCVYKCDAKDFSLTCYFVLNVKNINNGEH